jgi:WD40 repeat protein
MVALRSGAVLIYDLKKRAVDYSTEAGHSETIFETEFCASNPDLVASCSYDGTVRVWDTTTMKLVCINDTSRGTPQAKCEKRIIYSVSWHPT